MAVGMALSTLLSVKEAATANARDLARRTHGRRSAVSSNRQLRDSILLSSLDVSSIASDITGSTGLKPHGIARWVHLRFEALDQNSMRFDPPDKNFWELLAEAH